MIRPEDVDLLPEGQGSLEGVVTHMIFKGVHYEMEVMAGGFEWLVHSTDMFPIGTKVSIHVDPFDIQIMNKPESEDEERWGSMNKKKIVIWTVLCLDDSLYYNPAFSDCLVWLYRPHGCLHACKCKSHSKSRAFKRHLDYHLVYQLPVRFFVC